MSTWSRLEQALRSKLDHADLHVYREVSAVRLWTWGGNAICEQGHTLKEAVKAALDRLDAGKIRETEPDQDF